MTDKTEDIEILPHIPGYRLIERLGRGGMAQVFLGVQEALGRKVAIKVLNPQMIKDTKLVERFMNEARTASQLEHPNIVTIHDVAQKGDICYIVMEYLEDSLVSRIRNSPGFKLDRKEAFRIIRDVARALSYAHKSGIIHRDIKPDNILFRKDNTPVLVDFGIARAMDSDSRLTTDGMIIGTPHYMSPEQCKGETIDGQSDLYGLGVVLYEMLTGDIPYKADSATAILVKHIQDPIPSLPPQLSKYQPLLTRMMAKIKTERVSNAAELLKLIDTFDSNSPIDTIEATRPEQWVFDGPGSAETARTFAPDPQPTVLSPYRQEKKRKPVLTTFLLLILLAGGGYLGYKYWNLPQYGSQPVHSDEIIDVDETPEKLPPQNVRTPSDAAPQPGNQQPSAQQQTETQPPDTNTGQPQSQPQSPPQEDPQTRQYKTYFGMAREYFKDKDITKAREKLKQAAAIKDTEETAALQKQIDDFEEAEKDKEYRGQLSRALSALKKGDYKTAKTHAGRAAKIKTTSTLEDLNRKIARKEQAARAAARRRKLDDDAYHNALSRNTIYSYEKYLKRYPRGHHAKEATNKLENLKNATSLEIKIKDDVAYETAVSGNTISSFEKYLKEFPFGQHAAEARKKMEQLKIRLAKEVKDKITIRRVRFFESGSKAVPQDQRSYGSRFPRSSTRYIFTELNYRNNLYRIADSTNRVVIEYKGLFTQELKGIINPVKEAQNGVYSRGMGWTDMGKWPEGTYTVTVMIEGKRAGSASFEIY